MVTSLARTLAGPSAVWSPSDCCQSHFNQLCLSAIFFYSSPPSRPYIPFIDFIQQSITNMASAYQGYGGPQLPPANDGSYQANVNANYNSNSSSTFNIKAAEDARAIARTPSP